jgi:hypothetical protein
MTLSHERYDVLSHADGTIHLLPTDVAQFQRLDGCVRFLRWRLYEQNTGAAMLQRVMKRCGVQYQPPSPLPVSKGAAFESSVTARLGTAVTDMAGIDEIHNEAVLDLLRQLRPGDVRYVLQPNLALVYANWTLRGRPDMLRMWFDAEQGVVRVFIVDIKSTYSVKNEHQLQVAMYHLMLAQLCEQAGIVVSIGTAILHQVPPDLPQHAFERARIIRAQQSARRWLGWDGVCFDETLYPEQFRDEVAQLLWAGADSPLESALRAPFATLPFGYTQSCESCPYMELCLYHSAVQQDIALVPQMDRESRAALRHHHVESIAQLAKLHSSTTLQARATPVAPTDQVQALYRNEQVAAWLDTWIVRAQRALALAQSGVTVGRTLDHVPTTLPKIDAQRNSDTVVIYLDVQHDHFQGALWQCAALCVPHQHGQPLPAIPVAVVSDAPPTSEHETALVLGFLQALKHVWQTQIGRPAPVHFVVYEQTTWNAWLRALDRVAASHAEAHAWHDLLTTPLAFNQVRVTILQQEVNFNNRNGLVVASLMSVAGQCRFPWADETHNYRTLLRTQHFDAMGRIDAGGVFFTRRARFSSQLPLEYVYAAWQQLPSGYDDSAWEPFRGATMPIVTGYVQQRLRALHSVATQWGRWYQVAPPPLVDLAHIAREHASTATLGDVLLESMRIERNAELHTWMQQHALAPRNRVRALSSLLVEYRDEWQSPTTRERLRLLRQTQQQRPNQPVQAQGLVLRVRVASDPTLPTLDTLWGSVALASESNEALWSALLLEGEKPATPSQLLHWAMRVMITSRTRLEHEAFLDVEIQRGVNNRPYQFGGDAMLPVDGERYVLDTSPDSVPTGLTYAALERMMATPTTNKLYRVLTGSRELGLPLQDAHLQAYVAAWQRCAGPVFVDDALRYVSSHASDAVLLVQGPPGTGKTFTTAHAVMARMYAAMVSNRPLRVVVSCQTHAAVRACLANLAAVKSALSAAGHAYARQLRDVQLFRYRPNDGDVPLDNLVMIKDKSAMLAHLASQRWCVVGATPTSIESLARDGEQWCDLVILDEASQLSLPLALAATRPLHDQGALIVVGDPRQMPVIVSHDWQNEPRRHYRAMPVHLALFDYLIWLRDDCQRVIPMVKLNRSYRVPARLADFLCHEIYQHDGIDYRGMVQRAMPTVRATHPLVAAALHADFPLVLIRHHESQSQSHNPLEAQLVVELLRPLIDAGLDAQSGFGVVVPHRMQRSAIRALLKPFVKTTALFAELSEVPGIDTVERYQGSERQVMIVSATESDVAYIRSNEQFLFDIRRLNVALSRAQVKVILIASHQVLSYIARDQQMALQSQMWKNYQNQWCTTRLWQGSFVNVELEVWGG